MQAGPQHTEFKALSCPCLDPAATQHAKMQAIRSSTAIRPCQRSAAAPRAIGRPLPRSLVVRRAAADETNSFDAEAFNKKATETLNNTGALLKAKWEQSEDKPAVLLTAGISILALTTASSIVNAVDSIPIIGSLVELLGIAVTGWFVYRYGIVTEDREELIAKVQKFVSEVYGK